MNAHDAYVRDDSGEATATITITSLHDARGDDDVDRAIDALREEFGEELDVREKRR